MGAILPVLRNPGDVNLSLQSSSTLNLLVQLSVYAVILVFMLRVPWDILQAVFKNPIITGILLYILISCAWSGVPFFTLRRAIVFTATTAVGLFIGARFDIRQQLRLVAAALLICAALSVVFIVALPRYGTDFGPNLGAWRGVFIQKNIFARYIVIAAVTFICFRPETFREKVAKYGGLVLAIGLLIGSLSKGSYVVMLVSFIMMILYRLLYFNWKRLIPAATVALTMVAIAAVFVVSNADTFFKLLGKDATLNGRIPMWAAILAASAPQRWFGFGFYGFWSTQSYAVWSQLGGFTPLKAHNGFIDVLADLGLVGLNLVALNFLVVFWRAMRLVGREKTLESQWPLMMLSLILLYNLFESDLMLVNGFMWIFFVAITVTTQRALSAYRVPVLRVASSTLPMPDATYNPCPQ
jgi:exopolysaccharide production protein ExoQ